MLSLHSKAISHCVSALAAGAGACSEQLGWHCHMSGKRGLEEHYACCLGGKEFQKTAEAWRLPGIWDWTEKKQE